MPKTVKLSFHGLMLFSFEKDLKECRVGIHTDAPGHQVTVKIDKGNLEHVYSHDHIKKFKHLWLYAAAAEGGLTPLRKTVSKRQKGNPTNDESFDHIVDLGDKRLHDQPFTPKLNFFSPLLHIVGGEYFTKTKSNDCRKVRVQALENMYYSFFQPQASNVLDKLTEAKNMYAEFSTTFKIATVIGVDFKLEDSEWLTLALGNESAPQYSLYSIQPSDGITFEINNLPSEGAIFGGHPDMKLNLPQRASASVEEQIHALLPRIFHFLHYYPAFTSSDIRQFVLLEQQDKLNKFESIFDFKPDPPCNGLTYQET